MRQGALEVELGQLRGTTWPLALHCIEIAEQCGKSIVNPIINSSKSIPSWLYFCAVSAANWHAGYHHFCLFEPHFWWVQKNLLLLALHLSPSEQIINVLSFLRHCYIGLRPNTHTFVGSTVLHHSLCKQMLWNGMKWYKVPIISGV